MRGRRRSDFELPVKINKSGSSFRFRREKAEVKIKEKKRAPS